MIIGIVLAADFGMARSLFKAVGRVPYGDKGCHLVLVGILSFLFTRSLNCRTFRIGPIVISNAVAILSIAVTLEELSQLAIPSRTFDRLDLAANLLGTVAFGYLAVWIHRSRSTDREPTDDENS